MSSRTKEIVCSMLRLATGEAGGRVASFILFAYISRHLGVEMLGIVALSQTIATYVIYGSEQGFRMIGARLVAQYPSAASSIIEEVVKKRTIVTVLSVFLGSAYALLGPVPTQARPYVLCFVLAVLPYAVSLDWLAWGFGHLGWLGVWRASISFLFMTIAIAGMHFTGHVFASITVANGLSTVLAASVLWLVWLASWRKRPFVPSADEAASEIADELRWIPVVTLGFASILNLVFNNFDTVMLAAMSTAAEVGRYNAAYKILFLIFGAYYLLTNTLYPQFSRMKSGEKAQSLIIRAFFAVGAIGLLIAVIAEPNAHFILQVIYGSDLNATRLLRILLWAIPLDFCWSMIGTVLVSRGFKREILWAAGSAALVNISLNSVLIPRFQAEGAAWATLISYLFGAVLLFAIFFRSRVFNRQGDTGARDTLGPDVAFSTKLQS